MSYILDALGKAEKEQNQDTLPEMNLGLFEAQKLQKQRQRRVWWLMVISCAIGLIVGLLLRPLVDQLWQQPSALMVRDAPPKGKKPAALQPQPGVISPAPINDVLVSLPVEATKPMPLSLNVISYSVQADQRFAMINGAIVREGDVLADRSVVIKIEVDGVQLRGLGSEERFLALE